MLSQEETFKHGDSVTSEKTTIEVRVTCHLYAKARGAGFTKSYKTWSLKIHKLHTRKLYRFAAQDLLLSTMGRQHPIKWASKHTSLKQHSTSSVFKSLYSTKPDLKLKVKLLTRPPAQPGSLAAAAAVNLTRRWRDACMHTQLHTHTPTHNQQKSWGLCSPTLKPALHGPLCAVAPLHWPGQRPAPLIPNPVLSWVTGRGSGPWAPLLHFHCCYL